jgi:hypothetical protein
MPLQTLEELKAELEELRSRGKAAHYHEHRQVERRKALVAAEIARLEALPEPATRS